MCSVFLQNQLVSCMIVRLLHSGDQRPSSCLHCSLLISDVSIISNLPIRFNHCPSKLGHQPDTAWRNRCSVSLVLLLATFTFHLCYFFVTCRLSWLKMVCMCSFKVATEKKKCSFHFIVSGSHLILHFKKLGCCVKLQWKQNSSKILMVNLDPSLLVNDWAFWWFLPFTPNHVATTCYQWTYLTLQCSRWVFF